MNVLDRKAIAAHVLRHLANAQARGRMARLDELAMEVGVRRTDVREVVSQLDAEGHVDATRLKLTMTGLVLAASMRATKLRPVRIAAKATAMVKVA